MRLRKPYHLIAIILWYAVIFWFSSQADLPSQSVDWLDFFFKKSAHVGEFMILTVLLFLYLRPHTKAVAPLAILAAFSDEIHQLFTPGRGAKLTDVLIDSIGIVIALIIMMRFYGKSRSTHHSRRNR